MIESDLFHRVKSLCVENKTSINALLTEVTGSTGNLPTWKKGHIRADYLVAICTKFNVSADFLLDTKVTIHRIFDLSERVLSFAERFDSLDDDGQAVVSNAIIQEERRIAAVVRPSSQLKP
jgi:hypothetical protein